MDRQASRCGRRSTLPIVDFYIVRRLSTETRYVLLALLDGPRETYGFAIAQATGLPSGSIYPILRRLEERGWILSRWETIDESREGRRRRRYYRLTDDGFRHAQDAVAVQAPILRRLIPGWAQPTASFAWQVPKGITKVSP